MKITHTQAREALARIERAGTPERAAHECAFELRAIEQYSCAQLSAVRAICLHVAAREGRIERLRALVASIGGAR